MAGKGKQQNKNGMQSPIPEGWARTSVPRGAQNWIKFAPKLVITGKLKGRFDRKDKRGKTKWYYQLELLKPCPAWRKPDKESKAEEVQCDVGEVVCIDEKYALECMQKHAPGTNVIIDIKGQLDIGNEFPMWEAEVYHDPRTDKAHGRANERNDEPADEIPF